MKRLPIPIMAAAALASATTFAGRVSAHVEVAPDEVGVAAHVQPIKVVVPNEKDVPTVAVRLVLPAGLGDVTPQMKQRWDVSVTRTDKGDDAPAKEIVWSGGKVTKGTFDDFAFTAQSPVTETKLTWKAYQTHSDGAVVSWDREGSSEGSDSGPASYTRVVNALNAMDMPAESSPLALILSTAAAAISLVSLAAVARRK